MRKLIFIAIAWFFCWHLFLLSFALPAFAEKIPALKGIPSGLPIEVKTRLDTQKKALEKDLADFQAAAANFNAQDAKDQSDAEYRALTAWRTRYIEAAKAFNREVDAAHSTALQPVKTIFYAVQLDSMRGDFSIVNSDGSRFDNATIRTGQVVQIDSGTRVRTGPTGRLHIVLPDETTFTIGPDSDLVMDDFVYDKNMTSNKIIVGMTKGVFRWVTGKVSRKDPDRMKVKLPVGVLGHRGTDVEIYIDQRGSGYIKLFSGMIEFTPRKTGNMFVMKEKTMVRFEADGSLSKPEPIK